MDGEPGAAVPACAEVAASELPMRRIAGRIERSDAARNRERILRSAERLFAERGVANVSMDDIARHAEVGKGTLYRRFDGRSGLALALLGVEDEKLQEGFLRGPPPLGPGAAPRERLLAFFEALARFMEHQEQLIREAERTAARGAMLGSGAYGTYHTHVLVLLRMLDPGLDGDVLAHVLLAPFRAELYDHIAGGGEGSEGRERLLDVVRILLDSLGAREGQSRPARG